MKVFIFAIGLVMIGCRMTSPPEALGPGEFVIPLQVRGDAYYLREAAARSVRVRQGVHIPLGATIHTAGESSVDLCIEEELMVRMMPGTAARFRIIQRRDSALGERQVVIELSSGRLLVLAGENYSSGSLAIGIGTLGIGMTEPGEYEIHSSGDTAVYAGRAGIIEGLDIIRPLLLIVREGQRGKPDDDLVVQLADDSYLAVKDAFLDLKALAGICRRRAD